MGGGEGATMDISRGVTWRFLYLESDGHGAQLLVLDGGGEGRQVVAEGRDGVDGVLRRLERLLRRLVRLEAHPLVGRARRVVVVVCCLQIFLGLQYHVLALSKRGPETTSLDIP